MMQATLSFWLTFLETKYEGSSRKAAAAHGIDAVYWWRMKSGEKTNPSKETLDKLGLSVSVVLYSKNDT